MKAKAHLTINCGCGFVAKEGSEAADHAATTGHTLTVNGTVKPLEERPPKARSGATKFNGEKKG
jgi:hypothetical protein